MAYFNRKGVLQILAEKPDLFSAFPETVLPVRQQEEMTCIPDIAACDCALLTSERALDEMLAARCPDAVLPTVTYCGIEQACWTAYDARIAELKKVLERKWHVYVLPPLVLGAPRFRSTLLAGYVQAGSAKTSAALRCAGCLFYRAAVHIPLCNAFNIHRLHIADIASCGTAALQCEPAALLRYCRILLAGYGVELSMSHQAVPDEACPEKRWEPLLGCLVQEHADGSGEAPLSEEHLQRFFEQFVIPVAANVMSAVLAGNEVDYEKIAAQRLSCRPEPGQARFVNRK